MLEFNLEVLENLSNALLRSETLSGPSLDVYLEAVRAWPKPLLDISAARRAPERLRRPVGHEAATGHLQAPTGDDFS